MPKKSPIARMLTLQEAARILDIHPATLTAMTKRGEIFGVKFGLRWRFRRETIDEFVAKIAGKPEIHEVI